MPQPEFRCIEITISGHFEPYAASISWAVFRYVDDQYQRVGEIARVASRIWAIQGGGKMSPYPPICLRARSRQAAIELAATQGLWS